MLLTEVARNVGVRDLDSLPAIDIVDLTHDSRQVVDGSMFACVSGTAHDGHLFAAEAISRGAVALVVDHELGL
ncbi:MAG: Mur ligase domain-containing protein, partial [Actinomycetota bacterium]|nr:Mur ligase domain-containing protein [Actinomycetota bacterium]